MAVHIAGQRQEVNFDASKEMRGNQAQLRQEIEMGIAELIR